MEETQETRITLGPAETINVEVIDGDTETDDSPGGVRGSESTDAGSAATVQSGDETETESAPQEANRPKESDEETPGARPPDC